MNRRDPRRGLLLILLVTGLLGLGAAPAGAHSALDATDPADGSQVDAVPAKVTLTFNEPVIALGSVLQVTGPGGNIADGPVTVVDDNLSQALRPGSPAGSYTVLWRVTSADGHPVSGQFGFTATAAGAGSASDSGTSTGTSTGTSGTKTEDDGSWVIPLLVVAALVVVVAGVLLASRRPRSNDPDGETGDDETEDDESTSTLS